MRFKAALRHIYHIDMKQMALCTVKDQCVPQVETSPVAVCVTECEGDGQVQ